MSYQTDMLNKHFEREQLREILLDLAERTTYMGRTMIDPITQQLFIRYRVLSLPVDNQVK